jgi:crotonobetainyl-CoA:carnitine CoA-transferase CaiB-like acyl-CoA transferase
MADHGADVVMIEPANGVGEPTRHIGVRDDEGTSVWFRNIARGKRSLRINLKDPEAHAFFLRLVDAADVMVEAFRPGVVDRLGIGPDAMRARNPRLVYCSISAFGQTGPLRDRPAHDLAIQALAGTVDLNRGRTDGEPTWPGMPAADMAGGMAALSGMLMALLRRETTGHGDFLDVSMHDALLSWTPNVSGSVLAQGTAPEPRGMRSFGGQAMNGIYRTSDGGFIVLGGAEVKFATALLDALGRPDLIPLAAEEPGEAQAPLRDFLAEAFAARTEAEWRDFLVGLDVCWAPVNTLRDSLLGEHAAARGLLTEADGARHVATPMRFRDEPGRLSGGLPGYGEHSEALAEEVGVSAEEVASLRGRGAL